MTFTETFIVYPANRALQRAVRHYSELFPLQTEEAAQDRREILHDNFIHTQGSFELPAELARIPDGSCDNLRGVINEQDKSVESAALYNTLGNLLAARAQQEQDDAGYEEAIKAFNAALEIYSQEDTPEEWAWAQYGLAAANHALGIRRQNAAPMKAAVDAATNALLVWTRQDNPVEWALTMHLLGITFHQHGMMLKGNRTLQKSVVAFKNALTELDEENTGIELMASHNNRGAVLQNLGESEGNPDRIEEAIRAYDASLDTSMAQQLSIHLANICRINMATAKRVLGEMRQDATITEEAADELEVIIECFGDSCQPRFLEHCQQQLALAREQMQTVGSKADA